MQLTKLEEDFAALWECKYPNIDLIAQYPIKRYRIDFCHPQAKVIIECQGGTWVAGLGHSSGKGIERDCKKFCTLAGMGYLIFPLTCTMVEEKWIDAIASCINERVTQKL